MNQIHPALVGNCKTVSFQTGHGRFLTVGRAGAPPCLAATAGDVRPSGGWLREPFAPFVINEPVFSNSPTAVGKWSGGACGCVAPPTRAEPWTTLTSNKQYPWPINSTSRRDYSTATKQGSTTCTYVTTHILQAPSRT